MVASQLLDVGFLSFAVTLRASRRSNIRQNDTWRVRALSNCGPIELASFVLTQSQGGYG